MRSLRVCLLALAASLLLSAPAAQADDTDCGFGSFPTLGNVHRFIGQPVTYDLTNNDSRYFQATVGWGDGQFDGAGFFPGDQYEFSHKYSRAGAYDVVLYVEVADPSAPGVCKTSFALRTVRVRGHGRRAMMRNRSGALDITAQYPRSHQA